MTETTIPTSDRFRGYANTIRAFLQEMHDTYSDYRSLEFDSPEQQQRTREWLTWIGSDYKQSHSTTLERLNSEYADVSSYWASDPAYALAKRKVLARSEEQHPFDAVTERVLGIAKARCWQSIPFTLIRKYTEANLKWQQALSLTAANFLDGTSYRIAVEARESVIRASELLDSLDKELEKPELAYFSDLPEWPAGNELAKRYLKGLKRYLQSEPFQKSLKRRKDKDLLARITANELFEANYWAFGKEYKSVVFILLGLSVFDEALGLEPKTLERISSKRDDLRLAMQNAWSDSRRQASDRKTSRLNVYSDPRIPNLNRTI
ncbi:hypothetical protein [Marinobacter sp. F4216]|uniref:hypothetical protein n=1 Tax=Marinobacter sp. F4216 TaxID=2874281 RepID=UPI001CC0099B|nr:hypothetical protein [Marinobacter sp. F4216]MBZ2170384.1 hypothetical protein [Marinobacter sp. F4216]